METKTLTDENLMRIRDAILKTTSATAIYLIGPRARGVDDPEIEYEIVIVTDDPRPQREVRGGIRALLRGSMIPFFLLMQTTRDFERRKESIGTLANEAFDDGVLIYGR